MSFLGWICYITNVLTRVMILYIAISPSSDKETFLTCKRPQAGRKKLLNLVKHVSLSMDLRTVKLSKLVCTGTVLTDI
jgi:hypothetical protein